MTKITTDKTLTPAEQTRLREFIQEVWTTAYWDTESVTGSLGEQAEVCAEILGFKVDQSPDAEDDDDFSDVYPVEDR
jgi:hypothetical protein